MTVNRLENEQAISGKTASPPRLESSPCSEGDPGRPSQKFKTEWPQAKDAVTTYLEGQRWFGAKDRSAEDVTLSSSGVLEAEDRRWLFALVAIAYDGSRPDRYFIPLGACGDEESLPGPEI